MIHNLYRRLFSKPDPIVVTKRDKPELTKSAIKVRAALRRSKTEKAAYVDVHMALVGGVE